MPELPVVEAARKAIEDHCLGRKIKRSIIADDAIVIDGVSRSDFEASILGKTIVAARRKGKHMWLELDSPPFPSFQFGMAGGIHIKGVVTRFKRASVKDIDEWPSKYSKFFVELDDGVELSFSDKRRLARVRLLENPATAPPISKLGPDALLEPMTVDELIDSLKKKKIGMKALLLDQSFISGIGNWIADEVLYQARIHPLQISGSLPKESCVALHTSIREVVQFAVEVDSDCSLFPPSWLYHVRWGKKAGRIDGEIEFIVAGGRTTAFVPALQKLYGSQTAKASIKPRKEIAKKSKGKDSVADDNYDGENWNASESGPENASAILKGGRSRSRKTRVAAKTKVTANSEDDNISNADKESGLKTKSRRTRVPPALGKISKGDKDGGEDCSGASPPRKTRNVSAKSKPGKSGINNDGVHSILHSSTLGCSPVNSKCWPSFPWFVSGFGTTTLPHPPYLSHSFTSFYHQTMPQYSVASSFGGTTHRSFNEYAPRCRLTLCDHHLKYRMFLNSGSLNNVATFTRRMKVIGVTAKELWNRSMPLSTFPVLKSKVLRRWHPGLSSGFTYCL